MADELLDVSGLNCPLPLLKTTQALSKLQTGQVLDVTTTDAGSVRDFDAFCQQTGHILLSSEECDGKYHFSIKHN